MEENAPDANVQSLEKDRRARHEQRISNEFNDSISYHVSHTMNRC